MTDFFDEMFKDADERLTSFDVVPRIISAPEWRRLSR